MKFKNYMAILTFLLIIGFKNNCAMESGNPTATTPAETQSYTINLKELSDFLNTGKKEELLQFSSNYKVLRKNLIEIINNMNQLENRFEGLVQALQKGQGTASSTAPVLSTPKSTAASTTRASYSSSSSSSSSSSASKPSARPTPAPAAAPRPPAAQIYSKYIIFLYNNLDTDFLNFFQSTIPNTTYKENYSEDEIINAPYVIYITSPETPRFEVFIDTTILEKCKALNNKICIILFRQSYDIKNLEKYSSSAIKINGIDAYQIRFEFNVLTGTRTIPVCPENTKTIEILKSLLK